MTGILKNRLRLLLTNEINLFGYHLPLDSHPQIGNNILIAQALKVENASFVFLEGGNLTAAFGEYSIPLDAESFKRMADGALKTDGVLLPFDLKEFRRVLVISGFGGGNYRDAYAAEADLLVTGELSEECVRAAEEYGIALYAAGHYNSEKWGIRALGEHLAEKFGLEHQFIDVPNPI